MVGLGAGAVVGAGAGAGPRRPRRHRKGGGQVKFRYHITSRHGSVLAGFKFEGDAVAWACARAASTFQTPPEEFSVRDMTCTDKIGGRLVGLVVFAIDSEEVVTK